MPIIDFVHVVEYVHQTAKAITETEPEIWDHYVKWSILCWQDSFQQAFVAGGECVEAIDISEPSAPVSIAQYRGGKLFPTRRLLLNGQPRFDNAHDLIYRDGYLYVTAQNDNQFGVIKINNQRIIKLAEQTK